MTVSLQAFIIESNEIEGIYNPVSERQMKAHEQFLSLATVEVSDLCRFVDNIQPGARLRNKPGMDVRVGRHMPRPGGPLIETMLDHLLQDLRESIEATHSPTPHQLHRAYEALHPFMDGNGRSGRVLWAWHMKRTGQDPFIRSFLHTWYYQELDEWAGKEVR